MVLRSTRFWPFFMTLSDHFSGTCPVTQECISIKECPYTKELFARVKSTSDNTERAQLIQALRLRVCGKPSDRTVCCTSLGQSIYCFSFNTFWTNNGLTSHPGNVIQPECPFWVCCRRIKDSIASHIKGMGVAAGALSTYFKSSYSQSLSKHSSRERFPFPTLYN